MIMAKIEVHQQPNGPRRAFREAIDPLAEALGDDAATSVRITQKYKQVLRLLDRVAVAKEIQEAAVAVLKAGFRNVVGRVSLVTAVALRARRRAIRDADI